MFTAYAAICELLRICCVGRARERGGVDKLHKVEKNNCGDRKTCKNTHTHTGRGDVDTTKTDANNNCRKSYAA